MILVAILAAAALAHLTAWQTAKRDARNHVEMLNRLVPDGPPGYVHDHSEVQSFSSGACHWDCWTNPWPPWNSQCTYHCPGGGGGGNVH